MMRAAVLLRCCRAPPRLLGAPRATRKLRGGSGEDNDAAAASEITRERARSTAEEFSRHAKERIESAAEAAKEAWGTAKETAAGGSTDDAKAEFKEKVEKGNYDKIGQD